MKQLKQFLSSALVLCMLFSTLGTAAFAIEKPTVNPAISNTAQYLLNTVTQPKIGSIGGEWVVIGLARSGYELPTAYYQNYYDTLSDHVKSVNGVLHEKKYTEYSRVALALTAIGKDPTNVAGHNLLTPLGDYDKTVWQGINGPIWALVALDSANYPMPQNPAAAVQATREMYVARILAAQLPDGGFSLSGGSVSDPDITGMALQALSKYQTRADVKLATERALNCLSTMQNSDGGYSSYASSNSESVVQVIVALGELSIPLDDARFVKNGNTLTDNLLSYYKENAGFSHTGKGSGSNQMATEQGFYGIVSIGRAQNAKPSLYKMTDAIKLPSSDKDEVATIPVTRPDKTFDDIKSHKNQKAIESLAERGILNGKTDTFFDPNTTMTRAEFASIIAHALGLQLTSANIFTDVPESEWFYSSVVAASGAKIVAGKGGTMFSPLDTITREEAGTMVSRAAKFCSLDTTMSEDAIRDTLCAFTDYKTVSTWSSAALAFCYSKNILPTDDIEIMPSMAITRGEVAQMVHNMLVAAKLI